MTASLSFVLPLPPPLNACYRSAPGKGIVKTAAAIAYEGEVRRLLASGKGVSPVFSEEAPAALAGRLEVSLAFINSRADIDAHLKVLLDALNGVAWLDDSQIAVLSVWKTSGAGAARVSVVAKGERYATEEELRADRAKRAATRAKRKATLRRNRVAKKLGRPLKAAYVPGGGR